MNYNNAKQQFEKYLDSYDSNNDKVRLKIIHTYGVVHAMEEICHRMQLSEEDTELARIIALLHDIGRFEQLKRFDSFEPTTMDHAAYGVKVLFEEGMIRQFVPEDTWDDIIKTSIAHHSDFCLEGITDPRTLLHARLIRDADKLDNCRVKLKDDLQIFMGASAEEIGAQEITPVVYDTIFKNQCIYSPDRVTKMDYWVSYVAYFSDIYFRASLDIIQEHNYLNRIIDRIPYSPPDGRNPHISGRTYPHSSRMYLVAIHIHPIRPYVKKGIRIFNFTENPDSLFLFHLSVPTQDTLPHTTIQEPSISYTFLLSYVIWKFFAFLPRGVQRGLAKSPLQSFYFTKTLSRCQISSTYSWIVLSDVNLPAHAVFSIAIRAQPFSSL